MNPYFNENTVLDYIKKELGHPYNVIEFDDDYLINQLITNQNYLKEFSQYFPKEERLLLTKDNALSYNNIYEDAGVPPTHAAINNRWLLESDNEILGVKRVINNSLYNTAYYNDMMVGIVHPIDYATSNLNKSIIEPTLTHHFIYPDILEVKGWHRGWELMAILETVHDKDLTSIPSSLHVRFNHFCLYTAAKMILHIRAKYSGMQTPFGELNINVDMLQSLADKKEELIESFRSANNFTSRGVAVFVM